MQEHANAVWPLHVFDDRELISERAPQKAHFRSRLQRACQVERLILSSKRDKSFYQARWGGQRAPVGLDDPQNAYRSINRPPAVRI